jgi:hypothetical protein
MEEKWPKTGENCGIRCGAAPQGNRCSVIVNPLSGLETERDRSGAVANYSDLSASAVRKKQLPAVSQVGLILNASPRRQVYL